MMDAKNDVNKKESTQKAKTSSRGGFINTVKDYRAEFDKIIWPDRPELTKKTVTVIVTSLLIGVIIYAIDTVYGLGYSLIMSLLA